MSAYYRSIRKGLLVTALLLLMNAGLSELALIVGLSPTLPGIFGDLLLIEVGLLTILGGIVEFSRSKGVYEFRRVAFRSKEQFSTARHGEASRTAIVFFTAGLALFVILTVLTLIE